MIEINESNMTFGPFEESHIFHIEQSKLYRSAGENIKTVEFLYSRDFSAISFIEAKSSSKKITDDTTVESNEFIDLVAEKFLHSFALYCSTLLGRHESSNDISEELLKIDISQAAINFFLVIHGHREEWLPPIREMLLKKLKPYRQIWDLKIFVLNDAGAQEYRLVKS